MSAPRFRLTQIVLGALLSIALPILTSLQVSRSIEGSFDAILYGDTQQAEVAVSYLKWFPMAPQKNLDALVASYEREADPERKGRLRKWYQDITGQDIDGRIRTLND